MKIERHRNRWAAAFVILLSVWNMPAHSQDLNPKCVPSLPSSLISGIAKAYPGHRILDLGDLNEATGDAKMYREMLGNKCPGIASGDFDGNGHLDYGLYLLNKKNGQCTLIASLAQPKGWTFEVLCNYHECDLPGAYYLKALEPGSYEHMLADVLTRNEINEGYVARIKSKRPGIYFGALETEGTAYFRTTKRWVKLEF